MKPAPHPQRPLVTAVVAVHNERRHVGECLESLREQTYPSLEILVVDDGSTDGTAEIATAMGVRVLTQRHAGKATAVNRGAREASGEVLLFLDGDMAFEPDYVERLVSPVLAGKAIGTAHGAESVANPGNRWARCGQRLGGLPDGERLHLSPDHLAVGSAVYRAVDRRAFLRAGGFDDTGYEDDQTLAPKLGRNALWVPEARAHHYNPETLREIWAAGRWAGASIARRGLKQAFLVYNPFRMMLRALRLAWRLGNPWVVPYLAARESGIFLTTVQIALGGRKHHGK